MEASFPGRTASALKLKARFMAAALANARTVRPFLQPEPGTEMARMMEARPQTLGVLVWPYQCSGWGVGERLRRLRIHCAEVDRLGTPLTFAPSEKLVLADLDAQLPGLRIVLDKPHWFMREGGLVLNLFTDTFRAFSLAYSLYRTPDGRLVGVIGSLQGRNRDNALDLYRDLTGALHGLRPRDFLLEVFRMWCRMAGVDDIRAVTQRGRHHNHPYFGKSELLLDYDEIWRDRGGVPIDEMFFALPVSPERRDLETIKPNKRSLYRRRFVFLDDLERQLAEAMPGLSPVRFKDT
jgi:uncharacterized protein VirK/YbjX